MQQEQQNLSFLTTIGRSVAVAAEFYVCS